MTTGWIKLHRSMLGWRWFAKDVNVSHLFIYILLKANRDEDSMRWMKDGEMQSLDIPAGSLVTSVAEMAENTGLTPMKVRRALELLANTGEIVVKTTNKNTIITVCKYVDYQISFECEQQTNNKQITNKQQTTEKDPNEKKEKVSKKNKELTEKEGQEEGENLRECVALRARENDILGCLHGRSQRSEALMMLHRIDFGEYERNVDEFILNCTVNGTAFASENEVWTYFNNWAYTHMHHEKEHMKRMESIGAASRTAREDRLLEMARECMDTNLRLGLKYGNNDNDNN